MNSLKQTSRYTNFNDSLTGMKIFKDLSLKGLNSYKGSNRNTKRRLCHDFPVYWIVLLCLLLFINDAIAEPKLDLATEFEQEPIVLTKLKANLIQAEQDGVSLIIVDSSLEQIEALLSGFRGEVHLLTLEENTEPFEQINQVLADEPPYSHVSIIAKTSSSAIYLGGRWIDKHYLLEHQHSLAIFARQFANGSPLSLYTTNLTASHAGGQFIGLFEKLTQMNVDVIYMQGQRYEPLWVQRVQYDF
ncbi:MULTISPECIES: DUF4347 domain-containing protein [unclassified Shewanella]|uniref:DUF4347 domain-containing protein n=1 Tax=unclassified Shewanella TaxID=196818 RepID=UPI001BC5007B|nr:MULTISPECIES: DUF4347 domain-containing protein [unclassified Shewanella]GIU05976.1 hypothetical protein TUM4444_03190 [Shewanella sp. MBTL60-112-B1]GIU25602.1 hypothetical protein TUM4445_03930 [Shewanella sp. MBTL60-112-B2]